MGYIHNTEMQFVIPPALMQFVTGTWADAVDSNVWTKDKTATDETATVMIPIVVPNHTNAQMGFKLDSIEIHFEIETAALDNGVVATVHKVTMPADGSAPSPSSVDFSYDTGHDTDAERKDIDHHQMTLTIDTEEWIEEDEFWFVELEIDAAATSVYKQGHAIAKGTLRL